MVRHRSVARVALADERSAAQIATSLLDRPSSGEPFVIHRAVFRAMLQTDLLAKLLSVLRIVGALSRANLIPPYLPLNAAALKLVGISSATFVVLCLLLADLLGISRTPSTCGLPISLTSLRAAITVSRVEFVAVGFSIFARVLALLVASCFAVSSATLTHSLGIRRIIPAVSRVFCLATLRMLKPGAVFALGLLFPVRLVPLARILASPLRVLMGHSPSAAKRYLCL